MSDLGLFYASWVWLGFCLLGNCSETDKNVVLSSVGLIVPSSLVLWGLCPFLADRPPPGSCGHLQASSSFMLQTLWTRHQGPLSAAEAPREGTGGSPL